MTNTNVTLERHKHFLLNRDTDTFADVHAAAVILGDGIGPTVQLDRWDISPDDARLLADSLRILADLAEGVQP